VARTGSFGTSTAPFGSGTLSDLGVYNIGDPPVKPTVAPEPGVMPQPVIPEPIVPAVTYTPAAPVAPTYDPAYLAMRALMGVPIVGAPAPVKPPSTTAPTYDPAYLAMRALMGVPIVGAPAPVKPPSTTAPTYDPAYLAMRAALGVPIKGVR
jgi:hypothetical protein